MKIIFKQFGQTTAICVAYSTRALVLLNPTLQGTDNLKFLNYIFKSSNRDVLEKKNWPEDYVWHVKRRRQLAPSLLHQQF